MAISTCAQPAGPACAGAHLFAVESELFCPGQGLLGITGHIWFSWLHARPFPWAQLGAALASGIKVHRRPPRVFSPHALSRPYLPLVPSGCFLTPPRTRCPSRHHHPRGRPHPPGEPVLCLPGPQAPFLLPINPEVPGAGIGELFLNRVNDLQPCRPHRLCQKYSAWPLDHQHGRW